MNVNLKVKIFIIFNVLFLCIGSIISFTVYQTTKGMIISSIGKQAHDVANYTKKEINANTFEKVVNAVKEKEENIMEMEDYKILRKQLADIKETNGLNYLYTMALVDEKDITYIVDGFPLDETEEASEAGEIEKIAYPEIVKAFETEEAVIGDLTYDRKWGANITAFIPVQNEENQLIGFIGADMDATDIYVLMEDSRQKIMFITIGFLLLAAFATNFIIRWIMRPLEQLGLKIDEVKKGNLNITIKNGRKDEIGKLEHGFKNMIEEIKKMIKEINRSGENLSEVSQEVVEKSIKINERTEKIAEETKKLKLGYEQQLRSVDKTVTIIKVVDQEIKEIDALSNTVKEDSQLVNKIAMTGGKKIEDLVGKINEIHLSQHASTLLIQELEEKSKQIYAIIDTIKNISNQTNLLALNASIEAARAGEAGRGFSVVANEVKKLADETGESVTDISQLIQTVQKSIEASVVQINKTNEKVQAGAKDAKDTGEMFEQIIASIDETVQKIETVNEATKTLINSNEHVIDSVSNVKLVAETNWESVGLFNDLAMEQKELVKGVDESMEILIEKSEELNRSIRKFHK